MINQIARAERENDITISTIKPIYMPWYGKYETAISFDGQETWRIAEGYETKEEAIKGHDKYVNMSEDELNKIIWIG